MFSYTFVFQVHCLLRYLRNYMAWLIIRSTVLQTLLNSVSLVSFIQYSIYTSGFVSVNKVFPQVPQCSSHISFLDLFLLKYSVWLYLENALACTVRKESQFCTFFWNLIMFLIESVLMQSFKRALLSSISVHPQINTLFIFNSFIGILVYL